MKAITRNCNLCSQRITGTKDDWEKHGEEHHPTYYLQGMDKKVWNPVFAEKKYWCPLDNSWYQSRKYLARTIKAKGWTNAQYYELYGKEFMPIEWATNENHKVVGNAHNTKTCLHCHNETKFIEGKWTYPAFCGSSCGTKWYAENTNRVDYAMITLAERKAIDPNHHLRPNQKQYWINKGHTEEESILKVKERNNVNTLEKYIERADGDVELGTERWLDRNERWLASMKNSRMYNGYSSVSESLFSQVNAQFGDLLYGKDEKQIRCATKNFRVDCFSPSNGKIIEFYGDYWHANPVMYEVGTVIKVTGVLVEERWRLDSERVKMLNEKGHEVLIVWESEYMKDEQAVIQRCIDFLKK